ncbi:MAG: DUF2809 domain-containing protein [Coleofasciculus sp. C2-GNP5-27]
MISNRGSAIASLEKLFFPQASPLWTAIGVCIVTCLLEVLQLWQPPFLQAIRATLLGRVILGNTFTWSDFPAYFIGSFLGWVWMRSALVYSRRSHHQSKS